MYRVDEIDLGVRLHFFSTCENGSLVVFVLLEQRYSTTFYYYYTDFTSERYSYFESENYRNFVHHLKTCRPFPAP